MLCFHNLPKPSFKGTFANKHHGDGHPDLRRISLLEDTGHCYSYCRSRHYQEEQQDLLECIERRQVHRIHAGEGHGADS